VTNTSSSLRRFLPRLLALVGLALLALYWSMVMSWLANADRSVGLALFDAEGPGLMGMVVLVLGLFFSLGLAALVARQSDWTAGLGVAALSLAMPAWATGSIDGWVRRSAAQSDLVWR